MESIYITQARAKGRQNILAKCFVIMSEVDYELDQWGYEIMCYTLRVNDANLPTLS